MAKENNRKVSEIIIEDAGVRRSWGWFCANCPVSDCSCHENYKVINSILDYLDKQNG